MADSWPAMSNANTLLMSSAQPENSCQSCRGAPTSTQMIGTGYGQAMSATTSHRPDAVCLSTISVMTSTHAVRIRPAARGVKDARTVRVDGHGDGLSLECDGDQGTVAHNCAVAVPGRTMDAAPRRTTSGLWRSTTSAAGEPDGSAF